MPPSPADGKPAEPKPDFGTPGHAHQAPGPAPQDRRAHGAGQAHHPALQLCRRVRRHRAGAAARGASQEPYAEPASSSPIWRSSSRRWSRALKEVPIVNASLDEAAGEIVLHDRYHIGIAVATPAG